ncbi:MAG: MSCRAMM family protein [Thermoplasmata archaeon]
MTSVPVQVSSSGVSSSTAAGTFPLDASLPTLLHPLPIPSTGTATPSATPQSHVLPPQALSIPTGTFTGYVNATGGHGLSGVTVQAYAVGGALCPATTCSPVTTNSQGYFSVTCPVGAAYLRASVDWWMSNITYAMCVKGVTTYAGTIFVIHDAIASGKVEANDVSHETISGVTIQAETRDLQVTVTPGTTTTNGGAFTIALPPVPSQISFSPSSPAYQSNTSWTNATPWENVSLGVIYLERNTVVSIQIFDAITGSSITTGAAMSVCSSLTNTCGQQGNFVTNAGLSAFGPPGPDYVQVIAPGYTAGPAYVVDSHAIGFVPRENRGQTFNAGRVSLLPEGQMALNVSLGASSQVASVWHSNGWSTSNSRVPGGIMNGYYVVQAASLDGYSMPGIVMNYWGGINATSTSGTATIGCASAGASFGINVGVPLLPLRSQVTIYPDTTGQCVPGGPTWPIPGPHPPAWGNSTVVNITPRMLTGSPAFGIPLNMTAGTYLAGNVSITGVVGGIASYSVSGSSQEDPALTTFSYVFAGSSSPLTTPWECGLVPGTPAPSGSTGHTFCAPVPPGPDELKVNGPTNTLENYTWAATATTCCNLSQMPARLTLTNTERWSTINLTALPSLYLHVYAANTTVPIPFSTYQVCTASSKSYLPCQSGAANPDGSIFSLAPPGWDAITVSASGYSPNTTWAYVSGNTSVSNVSLTPLSTFYGRVVDNITGHGLVEAVVQYCAISSVNGCKTLGAGMTTTDGHFNGTLAGGWLPWATYRIQATAAGYSSNWVWANATIGGFSQVPTITVARLGINTTNGLRPVSPAGAIGPATNLTPAGVWVDGTFIDNRTGWGVQPSSVSAVSVDGTQIVGFANGTNTGGYFNDSVPTGVYNLSATNPGYYSINIQFNASDRGFVHLGIIKMTPYPWVSGVAAMSPWANVSVHYTASKTTVTSFTPDATATGCDKSGYTCGTSGHLDTLGYFNVSAPFGTSDTVTITGTYGGGGPSVSGGFNANLTRFNLTTNWTNLVSRPPTLLAIFATVSGVVWDNSTLNASTGLQQLPARFVSLSFYVTGNHSGSVAVSAGGGGQYSVLLPSNPPPTVLRMTAVLTGYYYPISQAFAVPLQAGASYVMPNLNLSRWGWVETSIVDSVTHQGVSFLGVSSTFYDARNQTTWSSSGPSNLGGWVNLTAPVGGKVVVAAGPGNDYNTTNVTVQVNESLTTWANVTDLYGSWTGNLSVPPWGWVRTFEVNSSITPDLPTVVDRANKLPLPFAIVSICTTDNICGNEPNTNWMGQFVVDAPIGPKDTFAVGHPGYLANKTLMNVHAGQNFVLPPYLFGSGGVNLTGDGVVAGVVLAYPSGLPVPNAVVTVCPHNGNNASNGCSSATSNATGIFWVLAPPQFDDISVSATGYVTNTSAASPCSDCWDWVGTVTVDEYAYVTGIVRGLPSGIPITGATVAACSTLGYPVGACGFYVATDVNGHFLLPVPANTYVLQTNDTFYNSSYLPLALVPGQRVDVGTIFLSQFGWLAGQVYSSVTFTPVDGASVYTCARWAGGICTPTTATDKAGRFTTSGAPGPYLVSIVAPGYADRYVTATIVSGVTSTLPAIFLDPLGTGLAYPVTGRVVNASDPSQVISGAIVAALLNGTPAVSTTTDSTGSFHMNVLWGAYNLSVVAPGYRPTVLAILVEGSISGLVIQLSIMTYNVTGTITDALTHQPIAGVSLTFEGVTLAVTGIDGFYSIQLPNGTARLTAMYNGGGPVQYPLVVFTVAVNGAGQTHDVALSPPTTTIYGLVVDRVTGLALPGATVAITGRASDGVPIDRSITTDLAGSFTILIPQGTYTTTASISGYASATPVSIDATNASTPLTLELAPSGQTGSPTPTGSSGFVWLLGVVVVALGTMALVVFLLTRRPPRAGPVRAVARPSTAPSRRSTPGTTGGGG